LKTVHIGNSLVLGRALAPETNRGEVDDGA
jgi:hypothetical protein